MTPEQTKEFWERAHEKNEQAYLTFSPPDFVYNLHHIEEKVLGPPLRALEIGVGRGDSIRTLSFLRHTVTAVDISRAALGRVRGVAATFLTEEMPSIPSSSIDLGLCHLVFQHCGDEVLDFILSQMHRILAPGGIFSFQFAHAPDPSKLPLDLHQTVEEGIHFFRSLERAAGLVMDAGGVVELIKGPVNYGPLDWYIFHTRRALHTRRSP